MTETTQEHAVDHAASAPAAVSLDTSTTTGAGGDVRRDLSSMGKPLAGSGQSEQHGFVSHTHDAAVPAQSRAERVSSFDPEDFAVPTGREEDWRFTPIDHLGALMRPAPSDEGAATVTVSAPDGVEHTDVDLDGTRSAGAFIPTDRAAAVAFASVPSATLVRVPAELELTEPVRVTVRAEAGRRFNHHLVIDAGRYSKAIVLIDHTGSTMHAGNVEVRAGEGAHLTVVSMQQWDDESVHLGQHDVLVGRDATVKHVAVTLGGRIVRLATNVRFEGPGGEANLLGAFFADAGQHQEHRSFIDHAEPRCASNVTYKGALQGDDAHSVWVGDVLVRAAAEGTDSYELNRNLVLTDGARADSVPNLEIETGEIIQAAHASATGRFDDLQLFYLQSRGVPEEEARRLVVRGFFADVIHQIGVTDVQDLLMAAIEAELTTAMYTSRGSDAS
ncbi:MAG TPA: Fe-S cluster assembly protein SufD [Actinomycetales bacterium]|nr:Fe-S cluster assembly protein SufD [Actinomycetales bacterium]